MNSATSSPTYPSIFSPVSCPTMHASKTAPVEITSLRLSAAAAVRAAEPIRLPSFRLKTAIQSLTRMEQTRMTTISAETSTASGCRILPTELLTSSTPMTRIRTATARPDRYSMRAWP